MKNKKRIIVLSLCIAILVAVGCVVGSYLTQDKDESVREVKLSLNQSKLELDLHDQVELTANVATGKAEVTWSSSDEKVLKVEDGVIHAIGVGNAVVTAKCQGGSAKCKVIVTDAHLAPVLQLSDSQLSIGKGSDYTVTAQTLWKNEPIRDEIAYSWTIVEGGSSIISVKDNEDGTATISGLEYGEATLVAATRVYDVNLVQKMKIRVVDTRAVFALDNAEYMPGGYKARVSTVAVEGHSSKVDLNPKFYWEGQEVTDADIQWKSEDSSIVSVKQGVLYSCRYGTTRVTGTYNDYTVAVDVTVYRPEVTLKNAMTVDLWREKTYLLTDNLRGSIQDVQVGGISVVANLNNKLLTFKDTVAKELKNLMGTGTMQIITDQVIYHKPVNLYSRTITSADEFEDFVWSIKLVDDYQYVALLADINCEDSKFAGNVQAGFARWSMHPANSGFTGVFDGCGHNIANFNPSKNAMLYNARNTTVKNLSFTGAVLDDDESALIVLGNAGDVKYENIYVEVAAKEGVNAAVLEWVNAWSTTAKNVFVVFSENEASTVGMVQTGYMQRGLWENVYAVGIDDFAASKEIHDNGENTYGTYGSYSAFKSVVDCSTWDSSFWVVKNGLPYPKQYQFVSSVTIENTDIYTPIHSSVMIRTNVAAKLSLDSAARRQGISLTGNKIVIPNKKSLIGTTFTVTATLPYNERITTQKTFYIVELTNHTMDEKVIDLSRSAKEIHMDLTNLIRQIDGTYQYATLDGATLNGGKINGTAFVIDRDLLKATMGEKQSLKLRFAKKSAKGISHVDVIEIPVSVYDRTITTASELEDFVWTIKTARTPVYVALTADVDCKDSTFTANEEAGFPRWSLHPANSGFTGMFDGRGHTIAGFNPTAMGMFGNAIDATIRDVSFTDAILDENEGTLLVAGNAGNVMYDNIYVEVAAKKGIHAAVLEWTNAWSVEMNDIAVVFTENEAAQAGVVDTAYMQVKKWMNVYVIGAESVASSNIIHNQGDNVYGAYTNFDEFKKSKPNLSEMDQEFWMVRNGLPYPKNLKVPEIKIANTNKNVHAGTSLRIDTHATAIVSVNNRKLKVNGRYVLIPSDIKPGTRFTVTAASAYDSKNKDEKTFTVVEAEQIEVKEEQMLLADATEIDISQIGKIDGELVSAEIGNVAFDSFRADGDKLVVDNATLAMKKGEKQTVTLLYETKNTSGVVMKNTVVTLYVSVWDRFISNATELEDFVWSIDKSGYVVLTDDINCEDSTFDNGTAGAFPKWSIHPVGTGVAFSGVFDGRGHVIKNFNPTSWGMLGYVNGAVIKNISFVGAVLDDNEGALVAAANAGGVVYENIYAEVAAKSGVNVAVLEWGGAWSTSVKNVLAVFMENQSIGAGLAGSVYMYTGEWQNAYVIGAKSVAAGGAPSDRGNNIYGTYADYCSFKEEDVDFSAMKNDFWSMINDLPYPDKLPLPVIKIGNKDTTVAKGTVLEIDTDARSIVTVDHEDIEVQGRTLKLADSIPVGTRFTVTVTSPYDDKEKASMTFVITETKKITIQEEQLLLENATEIDLSKAGKIDGELSSATYGTQAFQQCRVEGSKLIVDSATLKTTKGQTQEVTLVFEEKNDGDVVSTTVVTLYVSVWDRFISNATELEDFVWTIKVNGKAMYVAMTADIDCKDSTFNNGTNGAFPSWSLHPANSGFTGVFDGKGHVIKNFNPTKRGMFGNSSDSIIKNLSFVGAVLDENQGSLLVEGNAGGVKYENIYVEVSAPGGVNAAVLEWSNAWSVSVKNVLVVVDENQTANIGLVNIGYMQAGLWAHAYVIGTDSIAVSGTIHDQGGNHYGAYESHNAMKSSNLDFDGWDKEFWTIRDSLPYPVGLTNSAKNVSVPTKSNAISGIIKKVFVLGKAFF